MNLLTCCFKTKEENKHFVNNEEEEKLLLNKIEILEIENKDLKNKQNLFLKKIKKNPVGRPRILEWDKMTEKQKYFRTYRELRKNRSKK